MARAIYIVLAGLALLVSTPLRAQDPQFSQYYQAPLYLNPAFAGSTEGHRMVLNYRNQWPALPQAFATFAASYDYNMKSLNSGFGVLLTTDKAGSAELRSTTAALQYAYKIQIADRWVFSPGIHFGYGSRSINFNQLLFGDQLEFGSSGDNPPSLDPGIRNLGNTNYMDIGTGLLLYNKNFWIGASAYHINEPNHSLLDGASTLPMKTSLHTGFRFRLQNTPFKADRIPSLAVSALYKRQGEYDQLDFGVQFQYFPIMAGLWYRGIPVQQNVVDNIDQDAVTFIFGLMFDQINVNYSYDMTISDLGADIGGAHEISIIYQFDTKDLQRKKRVQKFIPCPTF